MSDRGMMKWLPYKSLSEQEGFLEKRAYERGKQEKPLLSSEEASAINALLCSYHGQPVTLRYYEDGYCYDVTGTLSTIETIYKYIVISDKRVLFRNIVSISDTETAFENQ
jgi:hypothetical protein